MQTTTNIKAERPYPIQDLGPLTGTPDEVFTRATTLVSIFTKLCGLETLRLDHHMYGHTDCQTFVAANFGDPEAYLTVEHEISHIFFDSDLELAASFREIYVSELMQKASIKDNDPNAHGYKQTLDRIVHNAWNVLEDHRVRSLWEEIYPGGGYFLKKRWENIAEHCMAEVATQDILAYIARTVATGQDTPEAPEQFRLCKPIIDSSKNLVQKADKKTCIAATRQMLDAVADILVDWAKQNNQPAHSNSTNGESYEEDLLKHAKQVGLSDFKDKDLTEAKKNPAKLEGLSKIVQLTGTSNGKAEEDESGPGDTKYNAMGAHDIDAKPQQNKKFSQRHSTKASTTTEIKRISKMARLAAEGDDKAKKALEDLIKKGTNEMKRKIQAAKSELFKAGPVQDPAEADKVQYEEAAASAGIKFVYKKKGPALPKPSRGAYRLQDELGRIRMAIKTRLREEGDDIDIEAFIDAKISDDLEDACIFTDQTKEQGLELLVLTDCSGSMYGNGIAMVDQAMSDIIEATKNLKVKCHLWAFSNELYMFGEPASSVQGTGGGGTDLIPSLDAALEWATKSKSKRGIIMLTDGFPTSCRQRKSTGNPQLDMKNVIEEARRNNIVISILCINEAVQHYSACSQCGSGLWVNREKPSVCACGHSNTYTEDNSMYNEWFGKGNYSVVNTKADIAKQLPLAARALVKNHLNSCFG